MLKYWVWLATRKGMGARSACLAVQHFGSPEAVYFADETAYGQISHTRGWESLRDKDLTEAEKILRTCYEKGIFLLTMQDAGYPRRLLAMDDPPVVLYGRGTLPDLNGPVIGVVGTRHASLYGLQQARRMGYGLSRCGSVVVSGGAAGIDTEALYGALTGGSPVVAVLGCGVDVVYPTSNAGLFRDIAANGCLLSEYPPGTQPNSRHFPVRNRIISGLSLGVLVVEAPQKSGALITAQRALDQGRDVFALPANVGQETAGGNLQLLRDGAILVCDPWEVLQEYTGQFASVLQNKNLDGWQAEEAAPVSEPVIKETPKPRKIPEDLTPEQQKLVMLLEPGDVHIDVLSEQMGQSAGAVLALVTVLELRGLVQRLPGRRFSLAAEN